MKTERAIELLNRISDSQFDGPHGDERREALEMAVRALSGDGDLISRKMAIEAFEPTHYKDWYTPTIIETLETLPFVRPEVLACGNGELVKESDGLVKDLVKDCISRQVAIDIVDIAKDLSPDAFSKGALKAVRDKLSELPPENTKRKKGKWEKGYFYGNVYRCSVCHEPIEIPYTYCPSCGAFMSPYIGKLQRGEHDG